MDSILKTTGIYKFTFANGHYYIGQSIYIRRRQLQHIKAMCEGNHTNERVQHCFNKYGLPEFEVLLECNKEDLNTTETKYIAKYINDEQCCNICKEGRSRLGTRHGQKAKDKISEYNRIKGKYKPVYMFSRDEMHMLRKFPSITQAGAYLGCSPKDVQKSCKSNGKYNVQQFKFLFAMPIDNILNHIKQIVPIN